jgi:uroporphyrinogen-III decarboxylase
MTDKQWNDLVSVIEGRSLKQLPVGFIIDCPWLPNWYGINILDYFTNEQIWFDANKKAIETFPEVMFLPGFWSEFGMCTEPSAFGAKTIFYKNEFPFAEKTIINPEDISKVTEPNVSTDGLLPFVLNRLIHAQPKIEAMGHKIRFSVSRGPLNIATFLMGTTEFLMTMKMMPEETHKFLRVITDFLVKWHELQRKTFPTIDGMLVLDDIVGFIGEDDFKEFALPYFKEIFSAKVAVKFFHNDAECEASASFYPEMGVNFYNPGIFTHYNKIKELTKNKITILGNIPPRDVLAAGKPVDVSNAVKKLLSEAETKDRLVLSCAGGMPPAVKNENIQAFIDAAVSNSR